LRNGFARRRLVLVVVSLTRVGGGGCSLGCGFCRASGGRLHGGEELRRPIEGLFQSLEDLLVDSLDTAVVVGIVAGVVGLCLLGAEAVRDVHDWLVAVGVMARRDLSVGEVVDIVGVVLGLFGVGEAAGCSHTAENAAVCAVVVAHGCWLACEVASGVLDRAER
jgi:hypothetical protein